MVLKSKKNAAKMALNFIKKNMIVGLGSGSTVNFFIEELIEKKPFIKCIASSKETQQKALKGGLVLLDINEVKKIDLTVDGADEIDKNKNMIKGAGAALFKEKILAFHSKKLIIIVDETKKKDFLKDKKLPLEIFPFGFKCTKNKIEKLGFKGEFRKQLNTKKLFITENGNFILDINLKKIIKDLNNLNRKLLEIPGVLETGLFLNFNPKIIIGKKDKVEILD